jgi:hypothetical protein
MAGALIGRFGKAGLKVVCVSDQMFGSARTVGFAGPARALQLLDTSRKIRRFTPGPAPG